jgi:hypothetical protein
MDVTPSSPSSPSSFQKPTMSSPEILVIPSFLPSLSCAPSSLLIFLQHMRYIESCEGRKPTVIIGLSGNHSYYKQAMKAQMDDFVIKPMAPHLMLQRVCKRYKKGKAGKSRRKR